MAFRKAEFHGQKSFRIKHSDEKFLSKVLSKESSKSNSSFRVYYGDVPSAVPFVWETRPGTPKTKTKTGDFHENIAPPLTPPPSYYTYNKLNTSSNNISKSKIFLRTLLTRIITHKKPSHSPSSPSPSSSSFASYSSFRDRETTAPTNYTRRRFSSWGGERAAEDQGFVIAKNDGVHKKKFRAYNSSTVNSVKKVLFTIVGLRSAAS